MLAGTLGALLLLPFALNNTPNAYANIFLIDNFTGDFLPEPALGICDLSLGDVAGNNDSGFLSQSGIFQVINGIRECQLVLLVENSPSLGEIRVAETAGMYRGMSGTGVESMSFLNYDGIADMDPTVPGILNLDLTNSDNLRIQYSKADFTVNVTATLVDGGGDSASLKGFLDGGTISIKNLNFPLSDFVVENPLLSLGDIDQISINFTDNVDATDFDVEFVDITMVMVGGEMFPTDTTALLLAGAELHAIWTLPALAAIGIGALVVSTKRK